MTAQAPKNSQTSPKGQLLKAKPLKLWLDTANNQEVRIEIIPLTDVLFCILTFFILSAVGISRQQAINLDLPEASTGAPQMQEMLVVSLDYSGEVYLGDRPILSKKQLETAIESYLKTQPTGQLILRASRDASYSEVMELLDLLRQVGGDRVALATLPGNQDEAETPAPAPGQFPGTLPPPQEQPLQPQFPTTPGQEQPGQTLPPSFGTPPGENNAPLDPGSTLQPSPETTPEEAPPQSPEG